MTPCQRRRTLHPMFCSHRILPLFFVVGLAWMVMGCGVGGPVDEEQPAPLGLLVGDSGKDDGVSFEVMDYFRRTVDLPVDDLVGRAARLASDTLNERLTGLPFLRISLGEPQVYGLTPHEGALFSVYDLEELYAGLLERYGEEDFVTRINGLRRRHLEGSSDRYFAEAAFAVDLSESFDLAHAVAGVDVEVGFSARERLRSTIVAAYPDDVVDIIASPIVAVAELRNFVLPRDLGELSQLKPGESIGLEGEGVLALNAGANLPIFSMTPLRYLSLSARFSLGARVELLGKLDIQAIRGEGDDLYLDIGMTNSRLLAAEAALEDGYGLSKFPELLKVKVLGRTYSLGEVADRVVRNTVERLGLLDYGVNAMISDSQERVTISRFQIDLSQGSYELEQAVAQAMAGDLRLAQTLSDRSGMGIRELVSVERAVNSHRRYIGAHVAKLSMYRESRSHRGNVYIKNADGVRRLVFDAIEENAARFHTSWGYKRQLLTSRQWRGGEYLGATANLRLAISEADRFVDRDRILDHVDVTLLSMIDYATLSDTLTPAYESLLEDIDLACHGCGSLPQCNSFRRSCVTRELESLDVEAWRAEAQQLADRVLEQVGNNDAYDPDFDLGSELGAQLLGLKQTLSQPFPGSKDLDATAGRSSVLMDMRITLEGLNQLFRSANGPAFEQRLREVLTIILIKRFAASEEALLAVSQWLDDERERFEDLRHLYVIARDEYLSVHELAEIRLEGSPVGDGANVLVSTGGSHRDALSVRSVAEQKAEIATRLVDDLVDRAGELGIMEHILHFLSLGASDPLGFESHHLVGYTLLSMVPPEQRELLVSMDFESAEFQDANAYTRGLNAELIEAGEFDIDELLGD